MANTVRLLIAGIVSAIASLAILTALGCSSGLWQGKHCEDATSNAYGVLTGLLTTVIGLSVKLDALEEPKPRQSSRQSKSVRGEAQQ